MACNAARAPGQLNPNQIVERERGLADLNNSYPTSGMGRVGLETLALIPFWSPCSASHTHGPSVYTEIFWIPHPVPQIQMAPVVILDFLLWSPSWTLNPQSWVMKLQIQPQTQTRKTPVSELFSQ